MIAEVEECAITAHHQCLTKRKRWARDHGMKVAGPRKRMKSLLVMLAGAHSRLD
jgi:hypothetical protein